MKTITIILEAGKDGFGAYSQGDEGIYGMGILSKNANKTF